jgi:hypothetical protein
MTLKFVTWRHTAFLITAAGLWHVRSYPRAMACALFGDGLALIMIWFPAAIDELTFGQWTRGGQIDAHTPPFLIAAVGWILLVLITYLLFSHGWAAMPNSS